MKKLIFLILLIYTGYSYGLPRFNLSVPDTAKIISKQDSVATYDSTLIFVVQKKLTGHYFFKKMYFYQLKNILNTTLSLSNLQIPRLNGTPTTNIALKLFAQDTLYKADFNYNFRKIDSLSVFFSANNFRISGDTIYTNKTSNDTLVFKYGAADTTGYLKLPRLVTSGYGSYQVGRFGYISSGADLYNRSTPIISSGYGNVDTLVSKYYADRHYGAYYGILYVGNPTSFNITNVNPKTMKGMTVSNSHGVTVVDSSMTIGMAGFYSVFISSSFIPTVGVGGIMSQSIYKNDLQIITSEQLTNIQSLGIYYNFTGSALINCNVGDIIKVKYYYSTGSGTFTFYRINFSISKI